MLLFCLSSLFAQVILNVRLGKTYAMEELDEKIKQAMEESSEIYGQGLISKN